MFKGFQAIFSCKPMSLWLALTGLSNGADGCLSAERKRERVRIMHSEGRKDKGEAQFTVASFGKKVTGHP